MRSSHAAEAANALNLEFYLGRPRPRVPLEIAEALGLDADATVADVVAAIEARRDPRAARAVGILDSLARHLHDDPALRRGSQPDD